MRQGAFKEPENVTQVQHLRTEKARVARRGSRFRRAHAAVHYGTPRAGAPPPTPLGGSFRMAADRHLWLFDRRWIPPADTEVHATLVVAHGTWEHSGMYECLGHELAAQGIAVFAGDMRGWGRSDGEVTMASGAFWELGEMQCLEAMSLLGCLDDAFADLCCLADAARGGL